MKIKLYTSPEYDNKKSDFIKYDDLYSGDNQILVGAKYLPYHELERDTSVDGAVEIRQTRESLSRYTNFPSRAFRRYKSIIFQIEPSFDEEATKLLEDNNLINNIDGQGTNINNFIKDRLFKSKFIYGDSYLLTTSEEAQPIWDVPNPITVKDYSVKGGKLILFRYEYKVTEPRISSEEEPKEMLYSDSFFLENNQVRLARYKKEIKKHTADQEKNEWDLVSVDNVSGFDDIPVAFNIGESFIKDPANDILEYHNLKSALMNQLYHQAFDRVIITGDVDSEQKFAFSAFTVTIVRPSANATTTPSVTNIPAADTTAIKNQLHEANQNVFKSFYHYNRSISSDSGNTESADSQELAKEDLLNVISAEIVDLENQVNQGLKHLAMQLGIRNFSGLCTFNKEIKITDLDSQLREELAYYNLIQDKFSTWTKELYKRAVKRQNLENEKEIIKEIDDYQAAPNAVIDIENI